VLLIAGFVRFDPAQRAATLAAILEQVRETRNEAGCISYVVAEDVEQPGTLRVFCVWASWEALEAALPTLGEPYFFSTKATRLLWDTPLGAPDDVVLIFGRETGGLPADLHERFRDRFVTMPIVSPHVRSLNLSTSVAVALYELLRQRRNG
jgi:hypothetical protein